MSLVPIAAIFLIFYVLLIRPQQKQQKEHDQMLQDLKPGDKILTTGGLYGTIVSLKGDDDLEVKFSETVKLTVARTAVTRLVSPTSAAKAPARNGSQVS
jgi:preprotein translocase subunit YajC